MSAQDNRPGEDKENVLMQRALSSVIANKSIRLCHSHNCWRRRGFLWRRFSGCGPGAAALVQRPTGSAIAPWFQWGGHQGRWRHGHDDGSRCKRCSRLRAALERQPCGVRLGGALPWPVIHTIPVVQTSCFKQRAVGRQAPGAAHGWRCQSARQRHGFVVSGQQSCGGSATRVSFSS
jgi:hypothetical protein